MLAKAGKPARPRRAFVVETPAHAPLRTMQSVRIARSRRWRHRLAGRKAGPNCAARIREAEL